MRKKDGKGVGKQVSPTVYRRVPGIGLVTFWVVGGGVAFNVLCHEFECAADEMRLTFEELGELLEKGSPVPLTRVTFKHRRKHVVAHFLQGEHETVYEQAVRDGVQCVLDSYMLPYRIIKEACDELARISSRR